jgi:hypothetical protein
LEYSVHPPKTIAGAKPQQEVQNRGHGGGNLVWRLGDRWAASLNPKWFSPSESSKSSKLKKINKAQEFIKLKRFKKFPVQGFPKLKRSVNPSLQETGKADSGD